MDDIDVYVTQFIDAAEKLNAEMKELEPYFKSRAYKDDDLAKAKAVYPSHQANYEAALTALDGIDKLLMKYQRQSTLKHMEQFKAQGNMVRYYTEESMMYAQDLLALFEDPNKDIKNQEVYKKADEILVQFEASLEAQRKANEEAKENGAKNTSSYETLNGGLTSLVGSYRDLRQKKTPSAFNNMMKSYNRVVEDYNRANQFSRF